MQCACLNVCVDLGGLDLTVRNISDEADRAPLCTVSISLNRSQLEFSVLAGNVSSAEEVGMGVMKHEVSGVFTGLHCHL